MWYTKNSLHITSSTIEYVCVHKRYFSLNFSRKKENKYDYDHDIPSDGYSECDITTW